MPAFEGTRVKSCGKQLHLDRAYVQVAPGPQGDFSLYNDQVIRGRPEVTWAASVIM